MSLQRFANFLCEKIKNRKQLIKEHITNKYVVIFSPNISSKEDGEKYGQFCKYKLIKFCPYVDSIIENANDGLTKCPKLTKKLETCQIELSEKYIIVPHTAS